VIVAALALVTIQAPAASAKPDKPITWKIEQGQGLLYSIGGAAAKTAGESGRPHRTLYEADLDESRYGTHERIGRVKDLIFHYGFRLPGRALERGKAQWDIDDLHAHFAKTHGSVRARGKAQAAKKGSKLIVSRSLILTREGGTKPATAQALPFDGGKLDITSVFHAKKGVLLSAEFKLTYTARGKPTAIEGTLELKETIALRDRAFEREVDEAIQKALDTVLKPYLVQRKYAQLKGHKMGYLALMLYAARNAGLNPRGPVFRKALADLHALPPKDTYSVSLAIMATESGSFEAVKGRRDKGATVSRFKKGAVKGPDRAFMEAMVAWLLKTRNPGDGTWTYKPPTPEEKQKFQGPRGDHSNTQFAVLALHAAARSGVKIDAAIFAEIAKHFIRLQMGGKAFPLDVELEPGAPLRGAVAGAKRTRSRGGQSAKESATRARGFDYGITGAWNAYSSMSAAGTSSLAIALHWLDQDPNADEKLNSTLRRSLLDGLTWLQAHHTMRHNWPDRSWPFYHLYSLEKAFELTRVETIGGHDWWAEGAKELLLRQDAKGGWGNGNASHTALAVLFLTRATKEPELEIEEITRRSTGGGDEGEEAVDAVTIEGLGIIHAAEVAANLDIKDPKRRKEYQGLLEQAIERLEDERRFCVIPGLTKHLEGSRSDARRIAEKYLKQILETRSVDPEETQAAHDRWELAYFAGTGGDAGRIPELRASLDTEEIAPIRRATAMALSRLQAVEAVPDLITRLEKGEEAERAVCHIVLVSLTARDPGYDPKGSKADRAEGIARWRSLWDDEKATLLEAQDLRRALAGLTGQATRQASSVRLRAYGIRAVPGLISMLRSGHDKATRATVLGLLRDLTGVDKGADPKAWDSWWAERQEKG
jgi:HEAT repeat protein